MQKTLFWLGLTVLSFVCGFGMSFLTGTLVFLAAGAAWWWVVYRSGFLS